MKDSLDILLTEPVYVAHDSLNILNPDVICHHGILGMKWGIRRYQNKDGSLTAAGKNRYYRYPNDKGEIGNILTDKGKKAFKDRKGNWKNNAAGQAAKARHEENTKWQDKRNEEIRKKTEPIRKKGDEYRRTVDILSEEKRVNGWKNKDPKTLKRIDEAADLGLRALEIKNYPSRLSDKNYLNSLANNPLEKTGIIEGMGYNDGYSTEQLVKNTKDWFTWEDQTIGYSQTADLVNQGYSKEKVKDMCKVLQVVPSGRDDIDDIGFEMQYVDDDFIDACYLIKESQKKSK